MAEKQMLIGDVVEKALHKIGADKAAKIYEKFGKKPCGCKARRDALNKWHANVLDAIQKMHKHGDLD